MHRASDIRRRLLQPQQRSCTCATGRCIYIGVKTTLWGVDASGKYDEKAAAFSTVAADRADEASSAAGRAPTAATQDNAMQQRSTCRNAADRDEPASEASARAATANPFGSL